MITIIRWWRIKAKQMKIRLAFYNAIEYAMNNYKELIPAIEKILGIAPNIDVEQLQDELVKRLIEIILPEVGVNTDEE